MPQGRSSSAALRRRLEMIVSVMQRSEVEKVADLSSDSAAPGVGKRESTIEESGIGGIFAAALVPTGPEAIDVAVMHPKDGIASGVGNIAHALRVANEDVDVAVKAEVEILAEAGLRAGRGIGGLVESGEIESAGIGLVDGMALVGAGIAVGAVERAPDGIALKTEL